MNTDDLLSELIEHIQTRIVEVAKASCCSNSEAAVHLTQHCGLPCDLVSQALQGL